MKRLSISPASAFTFILLPFLFLFIKRKRKFAIAYLLVICFINSGCFENFYSTNTQTNINDSIIAKLKNSNKYYIIHLKPGDYTVKDISVNNNQLTAEVGQVTMDHMDWLNPAPGTSHSYKKADQDLVLNEIHIYALDQTPEDSTHLSIPVSSITRVDLYEKNIKKTKNSHIGSTIAVIVIPVAVIVAIVAIAASQPTSSSSSSDSTCNCPQVYTYDGSQYQFKSGVFSGAIYSSLEKTDYLPLPDLTNVDGKYMFRVMNNQQEEQYVNQLRLINVPHNATTQVLLDRNGLIHTYQQPVAPLSTSLKNDEAGQVFKMRDGHSFIFNQKADAASDFGSVILSFDKPADTRQAKLIVNAKNTLWGGYLFEEFSSLFGDKFQKFQAKQDKADRQKLERWQKEQALPLMVYVETDKGWQLADYFPITGNTAGRDMIMAVNIPDTKQEKIRIKIESAFMLWELDYIAMDFSSDVNLKPEFIQVSTAVSSKDSANETASLTFKDDQYSKLLPDEFLSVEFNTPRTNPSENSYFLVSTGYYHSLKQYAGKADKTELHRFKKKGYFSEFSENKFTENQKLLAKGIDPRKQPKN